MKTTYDNESYKELAGFETPQTRAFEYALDLSAAVFRVMKEQKITQKELAGRMGVSPARLSQLLNMQSNMTLKTIAKFELALGIELIHINHAYEGHSSRLRPTSPPEQSTSPLASTDAQSKSTDIRRRNIMKVNADGYSPLEMVQVG